MWFPILLSTIIFLIYLLSYKRIRNAHLPGPLNLPIIGSLYLLHTKYPFLVYAKLAEKYGKLFRIKMGPIDAVVVSHPTLLKKILLKNATNDRPPLYIFERFVRKEGILFSNGDNWKNQRKFLLKFLRSVGATKNAPNKQNLLDILQKNFNHLIEEISEKKALVPSDIFSITIGSSLNNILTGDISTVNKSDWEHFFSDIDVENEKFVATGLLNLFPILRFLPNYSKMLKHIEKVFDDLRKFQQNIINAQRESSSKNLFVDALLEENHKENGIFPEAQMIRFHHDVYAAGVGTTYSTISWIMYLLTEHQDIQTKGRQEIIQVLGDRPITLEDLEKLQYLQAIISECGRFRTTAPLGLLHYTNEDVDVDGVKIEKKTMIIPSVYQIHMDREYWKTPEEFNPDRFLNEDGTYKKHEWYIPFMTGLRICVGEDLARMAVIVLVAETLRNFEISRYGNEVLDLSFGSGISNTPRKQKVLFKKIS